MRCDARERFNDSKMPLFGETKRKRKISDSSRANEEGGGGEGDQPTTNRKTDFKSPFTDKDAHIFFHSFINSKSNSGNGGESNRTFCQT